MLDRIKSAHSSDNPRAPWQVAIELNRLLAVLCIFELGLIGFLVVWHQLNPVTKQELDVVQFTTGANNFVRVIRAGKDVASREALVAMEAERYVMLRETINRVDDDSRYKTIRAMSVDKVWNAFKNTGSVLLRQDGLKQEIFIVQNSKLANGAHQVEFQLRRYIDGMDDRSKVKCQNWLASMAYSFQDKNVVMNDVVKAFSGFTVEEYSLSKRSDDEKCKF